jgi:hypothetical protein
MSEIEQIGLPRLIRRGRKRPSMPVDDALPARRTEAGAPLQDTEKPVGIPHREAGALSGTNTATVHSSKHVREAAVRRILCNADCPRAAFVSLGAQYQWRAGLDESGLRFV